ncbi:uncharacterized protein BDZ99DRAFT_269621 [Mytilinidion resinicola]|uniref:Uncharacterized protein n=1 Tax=Mytilinidion resinicola TaxID=574789 RepID=A0A6A6YX44_9PEZI|nr:uncharacterized protein BDZ99DRAFT_269621 [Mytilinidion resinicola]KAF2812574.1 hypothetical protein BDZ99DRAFT_269621 [Mytilinidion resinicola]
MARGSKFSFPIPGRRNHAKKDVVETSSIPSVDSHYPEYTPRVEDPSKPSKAERLLGTSNLALRQSSRQQPQPPTRTAPVPIPEPPQSPGYMTVTVSEASFGSDYTDHASSTAVEDVAHPPRWQSLHPRPSSNLLGNAYNNDRGRAGSIGSTVSRQIHGQGSSSTLRSFYDAHKSPLAVSQQTSASAVRDMALRKGERPIHPGEHAKSTPSLPLHQDQESAKRQAKKNKPPRLDLSRLFPKPRTQNSSNGAPLLSPTKMVNSPMPMSATSEDFPRNPAASQRETTPAPSVKSVQRSDPPAPSRVERPKNQKAKGKEAKNQKAFKRDVFDNAKVNVRRPPRGIQHWFEGLDEEDEEEDDDIPPPPPIPERAPPKPAPVRAFNLAPLRKSSLGRVLPREVVAPKLDRTQTSHLSPATQMEFYKTPAPRRPLHRQRSASNQSVDSQVTAISSRSKFSTSNLQDNSVLSMSSSDEEYEAEPHKPVAPVRDSLAVSTDNEGEIIIGKAQAFEVKPRPKHGRNESNRRRPSESTLSMTSVSTSAATIEVMLSPDPHSSYLPRHSRTKASRHSRQPSAIPEHDTRPRTASAGETAALSPTMSPRSAKTSRSEPRSTRSEQHKLMAVTEEEEALLEMMRRKRAAMAKHSFSEGYKTALTQATKRGDTPTPRNDEDLHRTSGFLVMDSPGSGLTTGHPASISSNYSKQGSVSGSDTLTSLGSVRGRPKKTQKSSVIPTSILRDTSSSDSNTAPHYQYSEIDSPARNNPRYQLSAHLDFSPLDPFPSTPTSASIASPTTASHASPLPSPITPGRPGEADLMVKVAGSEPSCNGDEDLVHSAGSIEPFMTSSIEKLHESHRTSEVSPRARRRTASSGADVPFGSDGVQSQNVSRNVSRPESQMSQSHRPHVSPLHQHTFESLDTSDTPELYHSEPKSARTRPSRRNSSIVAPQRSARTSVASSTTPSTAPTSRSVRDSRISKSSRLSRENSLKKRESLVPSTISTRCSVSDDVLAAWGSLGGWRTFEERV